MPRAVFFRTLRAPWFLTAVASVFVSVAASVILSRLLVVSEIQRLEGMVRDRPTATTTTPAVQVVQVENPFAAAFPPSIVTRRRSPVLTLVRRGAAGKTLEERLVPPERIIGSAVAATSDGWLVTAASAVGNLRLAELGLAWNGRVLPVQRAVRDTATDLVFLKIAASDLPAAAFVRAEDVVAGSVAWVEPRPKRVYPETVIDVRDDGEIQSSERAGRRFTLSVLAETKWAGGAVWDERGQLIALLEARGAEGWRAIPAGNIPSALNGLLASGEISRASLGIRTSDLSALAVDGDRTEIGEQGAWVRADRRLGLAAVQGSGPSAKLLSESDVIERVERDILDGTADIGERLLSYRPGTTVTLYGRRAGSAFSVTIKLGNIVTSEPIR